MKIVILFITVSLVLINTNNQLQAQVTKSSTDYYCNYKVGDTLRLYYNKQIQVLIFVNEQSCFTCLLTIRSLLQEYSTKGVSFVIFFNGTSEHTVNDFKKEYLKDLNIEVVFDRVGAYHSIYGVKNAPMCMLLNDKGKLESISIPGSTHFPIQNFTNSIKKLLSKKVNSQTNLKSLQKIWESKLMIDSVVQVQQSLGRWACYLSAEKKFAVILPNKLMYLFGSTANLISIKNLTNCLPGYNPVHPLIQGEVVDSNGTGILICDSDLMTVAPKLLKYHIAKDTIINMINLPAAYDGNYSYHTINFKPNLKTKTIIGFLDPKDYNKFQQKGIEESPFISMDNQGKNIKRFGKNDPLYDTLYLPSYYWSQIGCDDSGNIYTIMGMSQNINIYDSNLVFRKSIHCNFDSLAWNYKFVEDASKLSEQSPIEDFKALQKKVTMNAGTTILIDNQTKSIYPLLAKVITNSQGQLEYKFYIHQVKVNGLQKTITLPDGSNPFWIDSNIIWCTENSTTGMIVTKYQILE